MHVTTTFEVYTHWRDYNASDFGATILLDYRGSTPRRIVMKEAGALRCAMMDGTDGTLINLPAGYVHDGRVASVSAAQTASFVAYW